MLTNSLLFVGDSHSHGYWYNKNKDKVECWDKNNYAEIYARDVAKIKSYVYSYPGAPNSKYPRWIKNMLNKHSDISTVLVQSTYWDRWLMAVNTDIAEFPEPTLDFLTREYHKEDYITLYDDYHTIDFRKVEWVEKPKWGDIKFYKEQFPDINGGLEWPGYRSEYMHIKFHDEIMTHLTYENYSKDIALIDSICHEHTVPAVLWKINDRVEFPKKFDTFRKLTNVKVFEKPASTWLLENLNINIDTMKVDEEHYNYEAHHLIAKHFIPELLNVH